MKKNALLFTALLFILNSFSQVKNEYDSLEKYSYYIDGANFSSTQIHAYSGTGFFVRHKKKLFFITALHVLIGCMGSKDTCGLGIKNPLHPKLMNIYLTNESYKENKFITIDVSVIKDTAKCPSTPITPDIFSYEVQNSNADTIYSIEKFLHKKLPRKIKEIIIFGFPGSEKDSTNWFLMKKASHILIGEYIFYNYYKFRACGGKMAVDSQDYIIKNNTIDVTKLSGYSGSPVFIKNARKKNWVLIGMFISTIENEKLIFLKPDFIFKAIYKNQ